MAGRSRWLLNVDYPRLMLYGLVTLFAVAVLYATSTAGTAFGVYNDRWDGANEIRGVANDLGVEVQITRNVSAYNTESATDTVALVLAPTANYSNRELLTLTTFLHNGGTLVVADDQTPPPTGNQLLRGLRSDARFENATLRDERYNYRGPSVPVALNVSNTTLTRNVQSLTLNYGTAVQPGNATILVRSSGYAYLDYDQSETITGTETLRAYPVAVSEEVGNGTVIMVSDPSVFINRMLEREGNEQFLRNVIGSNQRLLLDYSHREAIPPLQGILLSVRHSETLQLLVGLLGLFVIVGWDRDVHVWIIKKAQSVGNRRVNPPEIEAVTDADADDIAVYLRSEHPDWDEDRIQRLAEAAAREE